MRTRTDPATAPAAPELSRRLRGAAVWSGLNSFVLRLGQFVVGVVTAHIIAPHEFGVFAVALTVQTVISNVSELGASAALVRAHDDEVDRIAPTVATISIATSALLTSAVLLTAGPLATLLGASQAAGPVRVLAMCVLIGGITAVPYALLVRGFRQDKRFVADLANFAVSTGLIVVLGLAGFGAMALAVAKVAGLVASLVLLYVMIRPRYRPGWDRAAAGRVLAYCLPLAGASLLVFSIGNADYVVVGHILGALPLGLYVLAFNISGWPVSVFTLMINEVALPAFARVRDDAAGLASRTSSAIAVTAAVALPVSALILALARPLVESVYGTRWAGAVPVLAVLGVLGSVRIVSTLLSNVLAAVGRSREVLLVQVAWIVTLVPALVYAVSGDGIVGAAWAQQAVALLVVVPLTLVLVTRAGCGPVTGLLRPCTVPLTAAAAAGGLAYGVTLLVDGPLTQLVAGGTVGVLVYVGLAGRWARRQITAAAALWNSTTATAPAVLDLARPA